MTLIKRLCEPESFLGGQGRLTLQGGEVVKLRGGLLSRLFLFGDGSGFTFAAISDGASTVFIPDALGAAVRIGLVFFEVEVDPLRIIFTSGYSKISMNFGIRSCFEGLDFFFAFREDGESRGLYASGGSDIKTTVAGAEPGDGAGGIKTDELVGFGTALCGVREVRHAFAIAEIGPGFLNGTSGHGLHPEAFDGLIHAADVHDVLEDEFTFTTGITSIHDLSHGLGAGELENVTEAAFGLFDRLKIEFFRNGREDVELPWEILSVRAGGHF